MKTLVLDLETQKMVEDWAKPWEAGLSCCGVWISWLGGSDGRLRLFGADDVERIVQLIEAADEVVSWNGHRFDLPLLGGLHGKSFHVKSHFDFLAVIRSTTGIRHRLEDVGRLTLGRGKTGKGSSAPGLWQRRDLAALHTYCLDDVVLTRDLWRFACHNGYVLIPNGDAISQIKITTRPGMLHDLGDLKGHASPQQIRRIKSLKPYPWEPPTGYTKKNADLEIKALKKEKNLSGI